LEQPLHCINVYCIWNESVELPARQAGLDITNICFDLPAVAL
jgi:hypothetical protein